MTDLTRNDIIYVHDMYEGYYYHYSLHEDAYVMIGIDDPLDTVYWYTFLDRADNAIFMRPLTKLEARLRGIKI